MPPLIPTHSDESLLALKLAEYELWTTEKLIGSLLPGKMGSLKSRPDGTTVDGHHRIRILRLRNVDVDSLPHEIIPKQMIDDLDGC